MSGPIKPYKCEVYNGNCTVVREVPTGQIVGTFQKPREAKPFASFLNGGNGFNGYTPQFFLNRLVA